MPKSICEFDLCERQARTKGLCAGHYQQLQRGAELSPLRLTVRSVVRACSIPDCDNESEAKGLCGKHWNIANYDRHPRTWPPLREKIEERLDTSGECWLWTGAKDTGGYGLIAYKGRRNLKVHRAYLEAIGQPVPEGLTVDHLCRVHACCNPAHLEVVTHQENVLRGIGPTAINAAKTHCIHGHEYTPENTYSPPTRPEHRNCRECIRIRARAKRTESRKT